MLVKLRWGGGFGPLGGRSRSKKRAMVATVRKSGVRGWFELGVVRSSALRFPLMQGKRERD